MRVYRVEHKDTPDYNIILQAQSGTNDNWYEELMAITGPHHFTVWRGPYRDRRFSFDHCTDNGRPGPYDSNFEPHAKQIFGFKSLKSLFKWFNAEDRKVLREHDYHIVVLDLTDTYDIQICELGSGQMCFNPRTAKKVATRKVAI